MRRTHKGRRYDTGKATLVGRVAVKAGSQSPAHDSVETLYRTARGHWFLAGAGGALSKWGRRDGDLQAGERIQPLSNADAELWLEWAESITETEETSDGSCEEET